MINPPSDQGIPVLTEVISSESGEKPADKPAIAAPALQPAPVRTPEATPATLPPRATPLSTGAATAAVASPTAGVTRTPSLSSAIAAPLRTIAPPATPAMPVTGALPKTDLPAAATDVKQVAPNPDTQAGTSWSDDDWGHLETELRQRITRQVLGRIDFVLDHRVRSTLTDVIDNAIDGLATEIRHSLHATLTDMVARAVAQEIARIQPPKK